MRPRSFWLCSALSVLAVSAVIADDKAQKDLTFDMFPAEGPDPINISLFEDPSQVHLDFDLFGQCGCPTGECFCTHDNCVCQACPARPHGQDGKPKPIVWAGLPNKHKRHAMLITSPQCVPCQTLKKDLRDSAKHVAVQAYATLEKAKDAGYTQLPQCKLFVDGDLKLILVGGAARANRIEDWLDTKEESRAVRSAATGRWVRQCSGGSCRLVFVRN